MLYLTQIMQHTRSGLVHGAGRRHGKRVSTQAEALKRYGAQRVDTEALTGYPRWAQGFFVDPERVPNPYLDLTLQQDITEGAAHYRTHYAAVLGASLTAYLSWCLMRTLQRHPAFRLRFVEGTWYELARPPLIFPVAVGGAQRFTEVLIEDAAPLSFTDFAQAYRSGIDSGLSGKGYLIESERFSLAQFIGNLPKLRFSALTLHHTQPACAAPIFYFGQRYPEADRLLMPLASKLHHGNTDPFVLEALLSDFNRTLAGL